MRVSNASNRVKEKEITMGTFEFHVRAGARATHRLGLAAVLAAIATVGCRGDADVGSIAGSASRSPSSAELLAERLRNVLPAIEVDGTRCGLRFGSRFLDVVGVTPNGEPIGFAGGRRVALGPDILLRQNAEEVARIANRAAENGAIGEPQAAPIEPSLTPATADGRASHHPVLGVAIEFGDRVVHADGTMRKLAVAPSSASANAERSAALEALVESSTAPDDVDASLVERLRQLAIAPTAKVDQPPNSSLHPTVLWHVIDDAAFRADRESSNRRRRMLEAFGPVPIMTWEDAAQRVDHYVTRSGRTVAIVTSPDAVRIAQPARMLSAHGRDWLTDCWIVTSLPRTWRPSAALAFDQIRELELVRAGLRVARWNPKEGFVAGREVWQREILGGQELLDALPPHLPVEDLEGRLLAVLFEHGALRAAVAGASNAYDTFCTDAASLVRTPGDLQTILAHFTRAIPADAEVRLRDRLLRLCDPANPTACGGSWIADASARLELGNDVQSRAQRRSVVLDLPRDDAVLWAESIGSRHSVSLVRVGDSAKFTGPDLESALAAAVTWCDRTAIVDPHRIPIRRRAGPRSRPTRDHIDLRALVDVVAMRRFEHLQHALDRGALATAIESLSGELVRASTEPPPSLSMLLAELRIRSSEARGALALLDHVRTRLTTLSTRFSVDRLRLAAALQIGDRPTIRQALDSLAASLVSATDSPTARLREQGAIFDLLVAHGHARDGADFVADHVLPRLEQRQLRDQNDGAGGDAGDSDLEELVTLVAAAASFARDDDRLGDCLAKFTAGGSKFPESLRTRVEFASLRAALGEDRVLLRSLGRAAALAHVPLDVDATWAKFERHPTLWSEWLDSRLRRGDADLEAIASLAQRIAGSTAFGDLAPQGRRSLERWSFALAAVHADDGDGRVRALESLIRSSELDIAEDALAVVLASTDATQAGNLVRDWCTVSGDPFAALRLAWHPAIQPVEGRAVALATVTAALAGDAEARRIAQELAAIESAVARRTSAAPPKAR
jgi:hypothetical protein